MRKAFITGFLGFCVLCGELYAQQMDHLSSSLFAGGLGSVEVHGDYAYCGGSRSLVILSVADPEDPVFIGGCSLTLDVYDVCVFGGYAYAVMSNNYNRYYLQVVDIHDLARPFIVGECRYLYYPNDVAASIGYAYVASGLDGLLIVDVLDPSHPYIVAEFDSGGGVYRLFLSGNYIYLGCPSSGLKIVDVTDPADPEQVGSYGSWAYNIFVADDRAYLESSGGLVILDVSDPSAPDFLGEFDDVQGYFGGLFVAGGYAYFTDFDYFGGQPYLKIVDVSDASYPALVFSEESSYYWDLFVSDNIMYSAGGHLKISDVSDPEQPGDLGFYYPPEFIRCSAISENYSYVIDSDYSSGILHILDVADPYNTQPVANYEFGSTLWDVAISGDIAFVAAVDGLYIIDISDPAAPNILGIYDGSNASSVSVQNNYAFITTYDGMAVIDVSDPTGPVLAGELETPGLASDIEVQGDYAYVADYDIGGLRIIDVSDPANPFEVGDYDTPGYALRVAVQGNHAYVADTYYGLHILDISDPADPVPAGTYACVYAVDVFTRGEFACVLQMSCWAQQPTDCFGNVYLLDISDPSHPIELDSHSTSDNPVDVYMTDDLIFVADRYSYMILGYNRTGIFELLGESPRNFALAPAYPNPFNASTTIRYELPIETNVRLEVYDILGRKVETLVDGVQVPGSHAVTWDVESNASGTYFISIKSGEYEQARSCILVK